MAYCNRCGKELGEGDAFCHACGAPAVKPGGVKPTGPPAAGGKPPSLPVPPAAPAALGISPAEAASPPYPGLQAGESPRQIAERRVKQRVDLWWHLGSYVIVNAFLVIVWAVTGAGYPWFIWVMIGWGIGIVFHLMQYFMTSYGESSKERMVVREMEKLRGRREAGEEPQERAEEETGG